MNPCVVRPFISPLQYNLKIEKLVWISFKTRTEKQNKTELQGIKNQKKQKFWTWKLRENYRFPGSVTFHGRKKQNPTKCQELFTILVREVSESGTHAEISRCVFSHFQTSIIAAEVKL